MTNIDSKVLKGEQYSHQKLEFGREKSSVSDSNVTKTIRVNLSTWKALSTLSYLFKKSRGELINEMIKSYIERSDIDLTDGQRAFIMEERDGK